MIVEWKMEKYLKDVNEELPWRYKQRERVREKERERVAQRKYNILIRIWETETETENILFLFLKKIPKLKSQVIKIFKFNICVIDVCSFSI